MTLPTVPQMMAEAARALNERVAQVHEQVACPRCHQPQGAECVHVRTGKPVKYAHDERLRAAGIPLR